MLPVKKHPAQEFRTLEEIRLRKDELINQIQDDNTKFTSLWNQTFIKREGNTTSDYIAGLIANSVTAIDIFLVVRKLIKNYGGLFGRKSKRKR